MDSDHVMPSRKDTWEHFSSGGMRAGAAREWLRITGTSRERAVVRERNVKVQ